MSEVKEKAGVILADMGLTVDAVFVPWSQSRNAGEKMPSLNWRVTLKRNGKAVFTTDYMAGYGNCPVVERLGRKLYTGRYGANLSVWGYERVKFECEHGVQFDTRTEMGSPITTPTKIKILPDSADVVYSLVMDARAGEMDFEQFCRDFGYDTDSRKAEAMHKSCESMYKALVKAIGTDGLARLQEAFQDY